MVKASIFWVYFAAWMLLDPTWSLFLVWLGCCGQGAWEHTRHWRTCDLGNRLPGDRPLQPVRSGAQGVHQGSGFYDHLEALLEDSKTTIGEASMRLH